MREERSYGERPFVSLVGAGPGNPDYLTVRGAQLLQHSSCVVYDALLDPAMLSLCRPDCEKIYVGKMAGRHSMRQEEISALLVKKAREGRHVVRLKGGDPFVFGRGTEECEALRAAGIDYELVPGVTSAVAVPEAAGISLTRRLQSRGFAVVTGHTADDTLRESIDFEALARFGGSLVFLMGLGRTGQISAELIASGMAPDTPMAVISGGTTRRQHVLRTSLAAAERDVQGDPLAVAPAILVVGSCAAEDWLSPGSLPLSGVQAGICGTADFCRRLENRLRQEGALVQVLDYVRTEPAPQGELLEVLGHLQDYTVLVFTGRNAIRFFFAALRQARIDLRALAHLKIAAIGESSAQFLKEYGLFADWIPAQYNSEALGRLLVERTTCRDRILIPRAGKGSPVLSALLTQGGIPFTELGIYDTVTGAVPPLEEGTRYLTFASAAGVRGFFAGGGSLPEETTPVCIGAPTRAALVQVLGEEREILTAQVSSIEGLVQAIVRAEQEKGK